MNIPTRFMIHTLMTMYMVELLVLIGQPQLMIYREY